MRGEVRSGRVRAAGVRQQHRPRRCLLSGTVLSPVQVDASRGGPDSGNRPGAAAGRRRPARSPRCASDRGRQGQHAVVGEQDRRLGGGLAGEGTLLRGLELSRWRPRRRHTGARTGRAGTSCAARAAPRCRQPPSAIARPRPRPSAARHRNRSPAAPYRARPTGPAAPPRRDRRRHGGSEKSWATDQ